jgi:hypothetical protein
VIRIDGQCWQYYNLCDRSADFAFDSECVNNIEWAVELIGTGTFAGGTLK